MHIAVLGSGYVGLVTAAVFAELGNHVVAVDIDDARISRLMQGESPIYEPGLDELLQRNIANGRIRFTTDTADAVHECPVIFIAVGTPPRADGSSDLSQVEAAARAIAMSAPGPRTVVNKSTVPVGTGAAVQRILEANAAPGASLTVLSNPEFLREGTAIHDALHPDRIVIGAPSPAAADPLLELYRPLNSAIQLTDVPSAEMIKYASNAFLATKISFINMLADLCETVGADVRLVAQGMGADPRIGHHFLNAGIGYGGSCLPKDVDSLRAVFQAAGQSSVLLDAVHEVNADRIPHLIKRLDAQLAGLAGKTITVLGLTFKPDTDDLRESRPIDLCRQLLALGAIVRVHDPISMHLAERQVPGIICCANGMEAATGADAVILATEWREYAGLDLCALREVMNGDTFVDGRNQYDPAVVTAAGLHYLGVGLRNMPASSTDEIAANR